MTIAFLDGSLHAGAYTIFRIDLGLSHMPQSLAQIYLHLVFSTKERRPFLVDLPFRTRVHQYLMATCANLDCPPITAGGTADHVHILCHMGRTITVADLIRDLKRESSKWIKAELPGAEDFHWQLGYGAFSVSPVHIPVVKRYINTQDEHHRTVTF